MSESSIAERLSTINTKLTGILSNANTQLTDKGKSTVSDISEIPTAMSELKNPTGTINITENGTVDVTNYAEASVDVQGGSSEYNAKINTSFTNIYKSVIRNITELPTLDFGRVTSGQISFTNMPLLKKVSIINADGLSQMNQMFYSDTGLEEVSIDSLNDRTDQMFQNCSNLKSFLGVTKTKNLTEMSTMFDSCSSLIDVCLFDTSNVQSMSGAFSNCSSLITVPAFDFSNAENLSFLFSGCLKLENVPLFSVSKAVMLNSMFNNCNSLTDDSLNNIMGMCITTTSAYTGTKTLSYLGISRLQQNRCESLSNYQAFLNAGWTLR